MKYWNTAQKDRYLYINKYYYHYSIEEILQNKKNNLQVNPSIHYKEIHIKYTTHPSHLLLPQQNQLDMTLSSYYYQHKNINLHHMTNTISMKYREDKEPHIAYKQNHYYFQ
jgi:hypothetical protein